MKIAIGSDHRGFSLKEELKIYIQKIGFEVKDFGASGDESCDYPDPASEVSVKVSQGHFERGILICASGCGMNIVANKYPNIRAVIANDVNIATVSRAHNDSNIITIGSKYLWTTAGVFDYLNLRTNGYEFHMDLTLGKVPYTDAKVQAVFDKWDELVKPGYFLENHAALSWQEALTPMINGEAAMYVMGNFAVAPLKEGGLNDDTLGFFQFPEITPGIPMAEEAPTDTVHIPSKAKNKTDAKRFLIFMSRADVQEEINKILGQLPINKNSGVKEGDPFLSAGLNMLNNAYAMAQFYDRDAPAQMASEGMKGFQEYMSNPDRRQKILERLEKVRQRVYK